MDDADGHDSGVALRYFPSLRGSAMQHASVRDGDVHLSVCLVLAMMISRKAVQGRMVLD